jgi:hypothetical protein
MKLKPRNGIASFVIFLLWFCVQTATSAELPKPNGKVLLRITGNISNTNSPGAVEMDLAMLEALEAASFVTNTPWTDAPTKFTGVRINRLLEYVGANSSNFRASALDKYWNDLTEMDFDTIPAVIAYKINDEYMRVRQLGPLWIMFPFDEFPQLSTEKYLTASVWQVIEIEIQ